MAIGLFAMRFSQAVPLSSAIIDDSWADAAGNRSLRSAAGCPARHDAARSR